MINARAATARAPEDRLIRLIIRTARLLLIGALCARYVLTKSTSRIATAARFSPLPWTVGRIRSRICILAPEIGSLVPICCSRAVALNRIASLLPASRRRKRANQISSSINNRERIVSNRLIDLLISGNELIRSCALRILNCNTLCTYTFALYMFFFFKFDSDQTSHRFSLIDPCKKLRKKLYTSGNLTVSDRAFSLIKRIQIRSRNIADQKSNSPPRKPNSSPCLNCYLSFRHFPRIVVIVAMCQWIYITEHLSLRISSHELLRTPFTKLLVTWNNFRRRSEARISSLILCSVDRSARLLPIHK